MRQVVLASGNAGKLNELATLLQPIGVELLPQSAFAITPVPEDASTFVENAIAKARHATRESGLPAIADDSGLEVDALDGAPGVRSARFAGIRADDKANNKKLLTALDGVPEDRRDARYRAVVVFLRAADDPAPIIAEGIWSGRIALAPKGSGGFGYDPLFLLADGRTAAQLRPQEKNAASHRGQALRALVEALEK